MSETEFEPGDVVRLVDTHHMHNSELKKNEGRCGHVKKFGGKYNEKYLVYFEGGSEKPFNRFWVAPKWLEPAPDVNPETRYNPNHK